MEIERTELPGVLILTPRRFSDDRGYFSEVWNKETLLKEGIDLNFVQDNHSYSVDVGTVRGLHFQTPPHAQDKLVRCGSGVIYDIAVDIRQGSPAFGKWIGVELSAENGKQLLIPQGFLHGFVTRTPDAELLYKCSDIYAPDCDRAVNFADPELDIDWGISPDKATLSQKDANAPMLAELENPFYYEG
ncbi:dTDP-4-dehydrorhamnose 3,5-epimerase [Aliiroseovarius sp. YM-037]|uniref:dTDP-4-dehydrorhamnose 3,5-epimerase n=1 Tax=Aliiroseovarius sp. YM-037 TaxID=3341728 RepID=UPI003A804297